MPFSLHRAADVRASVCPVTCVQDMFCVQVMGPEESGPGRTLMSRKSIVVLGRKPVRSS